MISRPGLRTQGPVLAFRAWNVRRGRLWSTAAEQEWTTGVADAQCPIRHPRRMPHLAPAPGCRCGIQAVDSLATLDRAMRWLDWGRKLFAGNRVTGAVLIWGSPGRPVIAGELRWGSGLQFRAPHARIVALADSRLARRMGKRLGVPVVPRAGLEVFAREISGGTQLRAKNPAVESPEPVRQPVAEPAGEPTVPQALAVLAKGLGRLLWAIVRAIAVVLWTLLKGLGWSLAWLAPRVASNPGGAVASLVAVVVVALTLLLTVDTLVVAPLLRLTGVH